MASDTARLCSEGFNALSMILVAWLAVPAVASAHGPLHEQIEEVTRQIAREPGNARLYLKRAELHRIHRDWDAALADYQRTRHLDPGLDVVDFSEGRMLLEAGRLETATRPLDRFLARHPDDPEALWIRARVELGRRRPDRAAADFTRALARLSQPKPEHFIERANALAAAGRVDQAIDGLDHGIQRRGPLVTLEVPAIDFELQLKRYDAALSRIDRLLAQTPRKETWLVRRGAILAQAGRGREAREAFTQALAALDALPAHQRATKAMRELEQQCRAALARQPAMPAVTTRAR